MGVEAETKMGNIDGKWAMMDKMISGTLCVYLWENYYFIIYFSLSEWSFINRSAP